MEPAVSPGPLGEATCLLFLQLCPDTCSLCAWPAEGAVARSRARGRCPYLVGHCVLVRVPLLATLVFVNGGHDLQDVVVGGEGCGKDTAE